MTKTIGSDHWRDPLRSDERSKATHQDFFSIEELARRWHCCRGTVYNRIRLAGAKVLDFSVEGRKSKKLVSARVVYQMEARFTKALP